MPGAIALRRFLGELLSSHATVTSSGIQIVQDNASGSLEFSAIYGHDDPGTATSSRSNPSRWSSSGRGIKMHEGSIDRQSRWTNMDLSRRDSDTCIVVPQRRASHNLEDSLVQISFSEPNMLQVSQGGGESWSSLSQDLNGSANAEWDLPVQEECAKERRDANEGQQHESELDVLMTFYETHINGKRSNQKPPRKSPCNRATNIPVQTSSGFDKLSQKQYLDTKFSMLSDTSIKALATRVGSARNVQPVGSLRKALGPLAPS